MACSPPVIIAARNNGGIYQVRIPDAVITRTPQDISDEALTAPNLKAVVEIKFNNQPRNPSQIDDYALIAGGADRVVELSPQACPCGLPLEPVPVPVPVFVPEPEPAPEPKPQLPVPVPVPVAALAPEPNWFERNLEHIKTATGLTGTALVIYLIVSEGSRILFPPRNLVPVP